MSKKTKKVSDCNHGAEKCEHIAECINCIIENGKPEVLGENDVPIYYCSCFYCFLEGKPLEAEWDSYGEMVSQVMDAFNIGLRDGKYKKPKIDGSNCEIPELNKVYLSGYTSGKNYRKLKVMKESRDSPCESSASSEEKSEEILKEESLFSKRATKKLRSLLRNAGVDPDHFTYDSKTYPKVVCVLGETDPIVNVLKSLGGRWNKMNAKNMGWYFFKSDLLSEKKETTLSPSGKSSVRKLKSLLEGKEVDPEKFTYDTETYPKAIVVQGETTPFKDVMKALGGKWNRNLKCGMGWVFFRSKLEKPDLE